MLFFGLVLRNSPSLLRVAEACGCKPSPAHQEFPRQVGNNTDYIIKQPEEPAGTRWTRPCIDGEKIAYDTYGTKVGKVSCSSKPTEIPPLKTSPSPETHGEKTTVDGVLEKIANFIDCQRPKCMSSIWSGLSILGAFLVASVASGAVAVSAVLALFSIRLGENNVISIENPGLTIALLVAALFGTTILVWLTTFTARFGKELADSTKNRVKIIKVMPTRRSTRAKDGKFSK